MIKNYTDIEQSKKLAEILPLESADMYYINSDIDSIIIGKWKVMKANEAPKQYISKSDLVAEIERLHKAHSGKYECDEAALILEDLEDFIDTLEVKEVDLEDIKRKWYNKGYIKGRKEALIPPNELGLPRSFEIINMDEVRVAAKKWSDNPDNTGNCDYIGACVSEKAFIACAEWLINKAQKGE